MELVHFGSNHLLVTVTANACYMLMSDFALLWKKFHFFRLSSFSLLLLMLYCSCKPFYFMHWSLYFIKFIPYHISLQIKYALHYLPYWLHFIGSLSNSGQLFDCDLFVHSLNFVMYLCSVYKDL
jgi:hypothetical protein